ncbi:efflux RND transporter periplasmic adaptor subunit [Pseudomarimonas salicorniae]|uniref:Efflux RND transporter periplasmic adaptor subunit n=1 Tax=Pseudomarimonas salicorniae TaxID=2933270 RepID=A0ABT0GLX0_9GAMM|nr:efflux RND transporter periplasmic adaptor subunit [Lysobacter sp. CAU 1642]MCK7595510.1 efflux RND transporter periplasmic adaptor subunit [Lysobacter sp. CAU 1642]
MNDSSSLLSELRIDRGSRAAPPPKPSRWPWAVAVLALLVAAATVAWSFREEALPVRTATAQEIAAGSVPVASSVLDASGYVTARRIATVSSKITGKVAEVLIEEGQAVEEGELLARLEAVDAQAQLALGEAQLAASRSEVARAEAQLRLAEQTLVRQRDLAGRKLVAQAALDQAVAERDALAAQLRSARDGVRVAGQSLALARIGLDNTEIRAPFAGVITVKAAQPGEMISPVSAGGGFTRTGIGTVVDMDSLEIQVDVNESFIGRVKPGQKVEAVLNAYPEWRIPAEVIAIVPTADRSKATVKVRIAFLERDARIVPDMGVRVSFLADAPEAAPSAAPVTAISVPAEAVVTRDGAEIVYVVRENTAQRREVSADPARDGRRRIARGLAAGERVVLSPPPELKDGGKVTEAES